LAAKKPLERVQESEKLLEKIMLALPGFNGYQQREQRREADRIVRDHIHDVLKRSRNDLGSCLQALTDAKATELVEPMNRLIARVDRVAEKVNHASYGYSGFFDAVKIEELELDRMLDYDTQLMGVARKFSESAAGFKVELAQNKLEDARNAQQALESAIANMETVFDQRKEIIEGVSV